MSAQDDRETRRGDDRDRHLDFVLYESPSISGEGYLADVSEHGLMVRTEGLPKADEPITIRLHLADPAPLVIEAEVRWTSRERPDLAPSFGVEIEDPSDAYLDW